MEGRKEYYFDSETKSCGYVHFNSIGDGSKVDSSSHGISLGAYRDFLEQVESTHGREILDLCRNRILHELRSGHTVTGQGVLESIMRERRPPVCSDATRVRFVN